MRGSVPGKYVRILQLSDVIQADAQANIIHYLDKEETYTSITNTSKATASLRKTIKQMMLLQLQESHGVLNPDWTERCGLRRFLEQQLGQNFRFI